MVKFLHLWMSIVQPKKCGSIQCGCVHPVWLCRSLYWPLALCIDQQRDGVQQCIVHIAVPCLSDIWVLRWSTQKYKYQEQRSSSGRLTRQCTKRALTRMVFLQLIVHFHLCAGIEWALWPSWPDVQCTLVIGSHLMACSPSSRWSVICIWISVMIIYIPASRYYIAVTIFLCNVLSPHMQ